MKKELIVQLTFLAAFFLFITLFKTIMAPSFSEGWFRLDYLPFWIGGIVGSLLVFTDHFVYAYFLRPKEESSQKARELVQQNKFIKATDYLVETHAVNDNLVFHNAWFIGVFFGFTLFVISSTGSLLGEGVVLAFLLHLIVDMFSDYTQKRNIDRWFKNFPMELTADQKRLFLIVSGVILLLMGLLV